MPVRCLRFPLYAVPAFTICCSVFAQTIPPIKVLLSNIVPSPVPGLIFTVAGTGYPGFSGGWGQPATKTPLILPSFIAADKNGNLYLTDADREQILIIDASTDALSVFAGTGEGGYSGDNGPAIEATLNRPAGIAFGPDGNLYFSDARNNVIRKVDMTTHIITTVYGTGKWAGPTDANPCYGTPPLTSGTKATQTNFCNPLGIAIDASGNFYFANASSWQVAKITASTGVVSVVAGTGAYGYSGDGGAATEANISWVEAVAVDAQKNVYFTDSGVCAIREVTVATGIIKSLVGVPSTPYAGTCGLSGDGGPASSARISSPLGIVVDQRGNVFFSDSGNQIVRAIDASNGFIYTIAGEYAGGSGIGGYTGDGGLATHATLDNPQGLGMDTAGNLYIGDENSFVFRAVNTPATAFLP